MIKLTLNIILTTWLCTLAINAKYNYCENKIEFKNELSSKILLCGENSNGYYNDLKVIKLLNGDILFDTNNDETINYKIEINKKSIEVISYNMILDNKWELTLTKIDSISIYFDNSSIKTKNNFVFEFPQVRDYNLAELDELYNYLSKNKNSKENILSELIIYKLFMGALFDIEDCKIMFVNLQEGFKLDGAIAETYSETKALYDYIIQSQKK